MTKSKIKQTLEAHFNALLDSQLAGSSVVNPVLRVEATGVQDWESGVLCILITPWFMSLMLFPQKDEQIAVGQIRSHDFPSGRYEFTAAVDQQIGSYESCSLFTPMFDFESHEQAQQVAESILASLMKAPKSTKKPGLEKPVSRRDLFRAAIRRGRDA